MRDEERGRERWREEKGRRRRDKSVGVRGGWGCSRVCKQETRKNKCTCKERTCERGQKSAGGKRGNNGAGERRERDKRIKGGRRCSERKDIETEERWGRRVLAVCWEKWRKALGFMSRCEARWRTTRNTVPDDRGSRAAERKQNEASGCTSHRAQREWERGNGRGVRATERGKECSLIWMEQDRPVEKATPRGENCAFSICGSEGLTPLHSPFFVYQGACGCLKRVVLFWNEKNQSRSVYTVIDHGFNLSVM